MNSADAAMLPVLLPLVGAALCLAAKSVKPRALARALEGAGAAVGLILPWFALLLLYPVARDGGTLAAVGAWDGRIGILQRFDGLAWLVDVLVFSGAGAAYLYSLGAGPRGPLFTALFLIQTSAVAAAASTADLFNLFVCLEVLGLASYVLVATSGKGGAFLASFSYLAISSASMVFFLFGVFGFYRLTGSLSYQAISSSLRALPDAGGPVALLSTACIAAAVAIRVAVMPVYGWLPDAHALAPHAVSAVLSGVLIKTPLFALLRLAAFLPHGIRAMELIGTAGALTAIVAVAIALSQKDAKRLLAYHSISQIGYVVAAWGSATVAGLTAAYLYALFHALFKGLLFLSVGTTIDAAGNRDVYSLRGGFRCLRASGDRGSIVFIGFLVGALSITAFPPFNGYAGKTAVASLFKGDWRYWCLFAAGIGTVASFVKLSLIFAPNSQVPAPKNGYRVRVPMKAAIVLLTVACLATGLAAPAIARTASRLLSASDLPGIGGAGVDRMFELRLFKADPLAKSAIAAVSGGLLFFLMSTKAGKRVAAFVRSRPRSFSGLVFAFCASLLILGGYLLYVPTPR